MTGLNPIPRIGFNMFQLKESKRVINKTLNKDLRKLSFWLALNIAKTETILFRTSSKNYNVDVKIKLYRKRIPTSQYAKYLGVFIDENLNWKTLINYLNYLNLTNCGIL